MSEKKVFDPSQVSDKVKQALREIRPEMDVDFCNEHPPSFSNNEIDTNEIELCTEQANKSAYEFLEAVLKWAE